MKFIITCVDAPGLADLRKQLRPSHLEYMIAAKDQIVFGGPVRTDDLSSTLGSVLVLEKGNRAAVEEFLRDEPYFKSGLFESVVVRAIDLMVPEQKTGFLEEELMRERASAGT